MHVSYLPNPGPRGPHSRRFSWWFLIWRDRLQVVSCEGSVAPVGEYACRSRCFPTAGEYLAKILRGDGTIVRPAVGQQSSTKRGPSPTCYSDSPAFRFASGRGG